MNLATLPLGGQHDGPHILITGGVHGDEYEPMLALRRLAVLLRARTLRGRVTLIPVVNEPAFLEGKRTGPDDLDLARTFPGRPHGSITEQIAHELSPLIQNADAYIDLHTGGARLQVYPLTGYMLHHDPEVLEHQRRMARAFALPILWGTDPGLDGRSLSVARDANVPSIYAEFLGGGGCDPRGVAAYIRGCLNVLIDLNVIDGNIEAPSVPSLVVEDPRDGSGHMQVQHPSPCDGFFEPVVTLGQRVQLGDPLGAVSDPLGRDPVSVSAGWSGVVLVLRTVPSVLEGDALAVVLETDQDVPPF
ncbi:MAG: M14 family metallopeptidase [Isosphaeraceae bacterium]